MPKRWMIITADQDTLTTSEKNALKSAIGKARNAFVNKLMDELNIPKGEVEAEAVFSFRYGTEKFAVELFKENKDQQLELNINPTLKKNGEN